MSSANEIDLRFSSTSSSESSVASVRKKASVSSDFVFLTSSSIPSGRAKENFVLRNFAFSDCDATACYDRILPHMLSMIYEKMGLPKQTCHWLI